MPRFEQQPINGHRSGLLHFKRASIKNILPKCGFILAAILVIVSISLVTWYNFQLMPVGGDIGELKKIVIKPGDNSLQIGRDLEEKFIIRSATAFDLYTRLSSKNSVLQAGTYRLSPAESVQQIVDHFVKGNVDQIEITFYPGATLADNTKTDSKKLDVKSVLRRAGYSDAEINEGLNAEYDSPLFEGKPTSASLEGYVYGETYRFSSGATVSDILERVFDEFYSVVNENGLIDGFAAHGLNLYQGITLASIVQREVATSADGNPTQDQRQVAQVFYSRLNEGIVLGSDVTYQYIADKTGVPRDVNLDSPYNTRRYAGLPPGPISSPGLSALKAVKNPADTSYMYFLTGDDKATYFGYTEADHQSNVTNHCTEGCSQP